VNLTDIVAGFSATQWNFPTAACFSTLFSITSAIFCLAGRRDCLLPFHQSLPSQQRHSLTHPKSKTVPALVSRVPRESTPNSSECMSALCNQFRCSFNILSLLNDQRIQAISPRVRVSTWNLNMKTKLCLKRKKRYGRDALEACTGAR